MPRKPKTAVALGLAALLALCLSAIPATATMPPNRCGKIEVKDKRYKVASHLVKCKPARKWSQRLLSGDGHPDGWDCQRYSPQETRIAFNCRKGRKSYYAVRK